MGELTRNYDWSAADLGSPDEWPQSLRTTVSNLLRSKFPMFLWWGEEMIQFYNDAYRPSLGNDGKHPFALGQKGKECWPEIWDIISPLHRQVEETGEATWMENQLVPIYRNGKIEDVYWTYSYSSVLDDEGNHGGILVTCMETTDAILGQREVEQSQQELLALFEESPVGIATISEADNLVFRSANLFYGELVGRRPADIIDKPLLIALPEIKKQGFDNLLKQVIATGRPFIANEVAVELLRDGKLELIYVNLAYQPRKALNGKINGVLVVATDVTPQVTARKKIEESEQRVRSFVEGAPFPIGVYTGKEMRIQLANQAILDAWGKGNDVIGKLYADILPELDNQYIFEQLDDVYRTGIPFHAKNQQVDLVVDGKLQPYFFNYSFTPLYDVEGKVYGVMNTAADVTELNLAHKKIIESEQNLRNVIVQAPVAMCILKGEKFVLEVVNDRMVEIWGKPYSELINKPIFEGVPEAKGQGFEELLHGVYTTGKSFKAFGQPINLPRSGQIKTVYLNFVYEAYKETDGTISGIMVVATEVTEQVLANKKIEESELRFRLLADTMPQFVWTGDSNGNLYYFNQAVYSYSGMSEEQMLGRGWIEIVHPEEREENIRQWIHSIKTGEDFVFHHRFKNKNGAYRWQLSRAIPQKDEEGNIQMWIGTSTDIHDHKLFEEDLQSRVKEQTLELVNTNEQLLQSNKELQRSNQYLEEFAHVASHDLKEPVRKIHFFTNQLKQQLSTGLMETELRSFNRIENAAKRMGNLIDDLLRYSYVSHRPHQTELVDLNHVTERVLEDLELSIAEKSATINITALPLVNGYSRQLQQLFQNLISNSLKYAKANTTPLIEIDAEDTLENGKSYHLIKIKDNGIGFEQQYAEKIFQMFSRLHGKTEYGGTGVGLSIVKKVVENHSGLIKVASEINKGSTFTVYLPTVEDK